MLVGTLHEQAAQQVLEIVQYTNATTILVRFVGDNASPTFSTSARSIRRGKLKNKNIPTVFGVGYLGYGKYTSTRGSAGDKEYQLWYDMLVRCYCPKYQTKRPTYKGVEVCSSWLNFQVFTEWYNKQELAHKPGYALDKDKSGSRIYSEDTCELISESDNSLLATSAFGRSFSVRHKVHGTYTFSVISIFAKEWGLDASALQRITVGKQKTHLGWSLCPNQ